MRALHSLSTERIVSIASDTMRLCAIARLHLSTAEPSSTDFNVKVLTKICWRIFWSAYAFDRAVETMFDLAFPIPDCQVTVKMHANMDDAELERRCQFAFPDDPQSQPSLSSVSAALDAVYCRQIQSEILNTILHRGYAAHFDPF
ncbi:hypothetical protein F5Y19DRAFT_479178 [Xylariaceae sp. FL1651]|nr:hypothetical protein F5Y19DRAFT_479178 [Xylariaceae sp. FL1651]